MCDFVHTERLLELFERRMNHLLEPRITCNSFEAGMLPKICSDFDQDHLSDRIFGKKVRKLHRFLLKKKNSKNAQISVSLVAFC